MAKICKSHQKATPKPAPMVIDLTEKGTMKPVGGASNDAWNAHLFGKLVAAMPNGQVHDQRQEVMQAIAVGQSTIAPKDPVEAMLAGQMIAAHEAACDMYRRAWIAEQSFQIRTRSLQLADKASRTVAVMAEALDRHRKRGRQQITVKHVTVNAGQAVVADQIVAGTGRGQG